MNLTITLLAGLLVLNGFAQTETMLERINTVPDVMQTAEGNEFPENGRFYCAAVAAANYMVWLSKANYPNLLHGGNTEKEKVLLLAKLLGGKDYMNLTSRGINNAEFKNALSKYAIDCGYKIKRATCWDFSDYSSKKHPRFEDLIEGLDNNGMVWLMLGKYSYDISNKQYSCKGLHYVALIGFDRSNEQDRLMVNCSSPRSGPGYLNEFITLKKVTSGQFTISIPTVLNIEQEGEGFWEITDGLKWKRDGELVLINGVVSLELL